MGINQVNQAIVRRIHTRVSMGVLRAASLSRIAGLPVYIDSPSRFYRDLLHEKVRRALDLIREVDERRFARLRRDVKRVFVGTYQGSPSYHHSLGLVNLPGMAIVTMDVEDVALILIHEATHARLRRRRITYDTDAMRGRVEQACCAEEIRFAGRLVDGAERAAKIRDRFTQGWWTRAARYEQAVIGLEHHRLPRPLRCVARALVRRLLTDG